MSSYLTDALTLSQGRQIGLRTQNSDPPTASYIGVDDNLLVQIWNSQAGQSVQVSVRLLLPDGTIVPNQFFFTPSTDRTQNSFLAFMQEGFLLSCTAMANAGTPPGRTFVRISLVRGYPVSTVYGDVLMQGYTGTPNALTWPPGLYERTNAGQGCIRRISGTTPAAAAEISETVPANAIWRLIVFNFRLTTTAAAGNRWAQLVIDDGTTYFALLDPPQAVTASGSNIITWAPGLTITLGGPAVVAAPMPQNLLLPAGYRIGTLSNGLLAGDQYSQVSYLVEEWMAP